MILASVTASFKFTYKAMIDVEDLPFQHMHVYTQDTCTYTHTHMSSYVNETFLRSCDTQNCSLVARPLFSFSSLSVHTARNKMQSESRATSTLHKIKGGIINRTILVFCCYVTKIKNSDLEFSDVACKLSNKAVAERMNPKHYPITG